jgi:hypothetical protein
MFGFPEYGARTVFMWSLSLGHATGPVVEENWTIQSPNVCWIVMQRGGDRSHRAGRTASVHQARELTSLLQDS